ncbi:MAG: isoleucine--tRNA ligase [Micavibrio sp.]|nr:isoleucine--tRNA ligase [Micavibrio sp.]
MTKDTDFKPYPEAKPNSSFPKMEEEILNFWKKENIFKKSIENRPENDEFVFYDGPPFANGLPHYGHLVTSYIKDTVPRYQTMRGKRVERRFGWDCHGLPAELQTEKELGISGRYEILDYGIEKFNTACENSVLKFTHEWESYVNRMGRWVDFDNDYKTLDITYMESVMWAFKSLWDKGYIYEGYRVVPYSWAIESPLSNFETRMDDSYRMRQDPAVTVRFKLNEPFNGKTAYLLAWTTTPWTLPSNLAMAVHPDLDYAVVEKEGELYILAEARLGAHGKEFGDEPTYTTIKGTALKGLTYEPLFPYFKDTENAFQVLTADYVSAEDGTGIVHQAPGFGEEDLTNCQQAQIPIVVPINSKGEFTGEVPDYEGMLWMDANKPITQRLKEEGKLVRQETIDHNYPHCWRTDQPLIYKAINSWYLEVSKFKDRMVELNKNISWIPDHIRDGSMGKWLENARDWNISRSRFWGAPIPVWRSDNPTYPRVDVYGSIEELEKDFGVKVDNLHRPMIDNLTRPNPDDPTGKSMMVRVEDVLDCWFESGSMPYAQVHYPFENKEWFDNHFPGDFIVEYIGQTRGWFYTLIVLSTALFDRAPFENCICHGIVLDENKQKLSKRKRNYPDPVEVFDQFGSDCMRWYLISSTLVNGGDLAVPNDGGKAIGQIRNQILNPLWNAYSFYTLYANADKLRGKIIQSSDNTLDQYILAKTRTLIEAVQAKMEVYDLPGSCVEIREFFDALTNWYIRRSRDRFWSAEKTADKQAAYDTLYTVLHNLCRVAAPFLPFLTETIYRNLTGEESVHLTDWPKADALAANANLVSSMDMVREVCSAALSVREQENLRVRLPLAELIVASETANTLEDFKELMADELNVKKVTLSTDLAQYGSLELKVNPQIGKKLKDKMKPVMEASRSGDWSDNGDGTVTAAGVTLESEDFSMRLNTAEGLSSQQISGQGAVILDTKLTPELEQEGIARDLIRLIQQTRKDADFDISDHIDLTLSVSDTIKQAADTHAEMIKAETLTNSLGFTGDNSEYTGTHDLLGESVKISVTRSRKAA